MFCLTSAFTTYALLLSLTSLIFLICILNNGNNDSASVIARISDNIVDWTKSSFVFFHKMPLVALSCL